MPKTKLSISVIPIDRIANRIFLIRGEKVMLDSDLAELYGVTTGNFNKAVKRNIGRFPADFMFQLNRKETSEILSFQNGISNNGRGGRRYLPRAFTEQGVAMLSSVLKSQRAIQVNIQIMRTFTRMRQMLMSQSELKKKIEQMESKYDDQFKQVFEVIKQLIIQEEEPREEIEFKAK